MAPPLLTLDGILLTFGGTPLLDGAELSASAGRPHRAGRPQRLGQIDAAQDRRRHWSSRRTARSSASRRRRSATCRRLPDMDGFATVRAYVEAGLGPADDPHRGDLSARTSRPDRRGRARGHFRAARRAARRLPASWRRSRTSCCSTSRPTISTSPTIEWLEDELNRSSSALVVISHDRRFLERVSRATVWLDRGKTRRLDKGFAHFEDWRDTDPRGGRARAAQARPPDRARGALAALRRHRAAQAQHAPAGRTADDAQELSRPQGRGGRGDR